MSLKIIVHCLVKNEERFIWYALNSVLPYVDKIMLWDTGSTDKTISIVKSIKSSKIDLREVGDVDPNSFTSMRQKMIEKTPKGFSWLMILDGDEVWPENSIKKATHFAQTHPQYESIVVRTHNLVGDIYHRLPNSAGLYQIAGHRGHLNLRFMNRRTIPGLHAALPHGQIGYFDNKSALIQNRDPQKIKFLNLHYAHATHLLRSTSDQSTIKRPFKRKYELGIKIPLSQIPQVFFQSHPPIVPPVTNPAPPSFWLKASLLTPFKRLRRLLLPPASGY